MSNKITLALVTHANLPKFVGLYLSAYNEEQAFRESVGLSFNGQESIIAARPPLIAEFTKSMDDLVGYIAYDRNTPVGIINCRCQSNYIGNHYVLPSYRRQGIGKLLLDAIIANCHERTDTQIIPVRIGILAPDTAGSKFYEGCGFIAPEVNTYLLKTPIKN